MGRISHSRKINGLLNSKFHIVFMEMIDNGLMMENNILEIMIKIQKYKSNLIIQFMLEVLEFTQHNGPVILV